MPSSLLTSLGLLVTLACAAPAPYDVTQAQWDGALARLARMRASFPDKPYTRAATMRFFEPHTRRRFEGRGAVGVDPGRAMRLLLVGPAGEPALDVWVTRRAWRMEVPAIHYLRRGGTESPPGLPVGFFRSWFIDPLGGRPLAIGRAGEIVVRDAAGGTLSIAQTASGASVRRRSGTTTEVFSYTESPQGGRARYRDDKTGLEVEIDLEPAQDTPPDPKAFEEPGSP